MSYASPGRGNRVKTRFLPVWLVSIRLDPLKIGHLAGVDRPIIDYGPLARGPVVNRPRFWLPGSAGRLPAKVADNRLSCFMLHKEVLPKWPY